MKTQEKILVRFVGRLIGASLALMALAADGRGTAHADSVADFYQGKRVTMYIGSSSGDGTDLYGRLIANFIGCARHLQSTPAAGR